VDASFEQTAAAQDDRTQEIMDQILDYMKVQLKPEMDQLEMQLHPESLGTLRIQLTAREGEVTAQFHVQNESVKAAIEGQLTILKDTLKEQGVKVEAVEVTVESHAFESNLWQGQERNTGESYQGNKKTPRRINLNSLDEEGLEAADEEERLAAEIMKANGGTVDYTA
jgi:flagellar hook-length control protein FliK